MTLREYFARHPKGARRDMAERLGISKSRLSLIENGHSYPDLVLAFDIERATEGLVSARSFAMAKRRQAILARA